MVLTVVPDVVSERGCELLREFIDANLDKARPTPDGKVEILGSRVADTCPTMMRHIRGIALDHVQAVHGVAQLYPDFTLLSKMPPGTHHDYHADNCTQAGESNHTFWHAFTAMVYFNDDFGGGELIHPRIGSRIKPVSGTMVTFPCGLEYTHGVAVVENNPRYAMAIWFTTDPNHAERW